MSVEGLGTSRVIRVFVVAEVCLYRQGLTLILHGRDGIEVVGCAADSAEAVAGVRALEPRPDFVLVDVSDSDGLFGIRRLLRALPGLRVVALTVPETEDSVVACAEAGAIAYVPRHGSAEEVVATIVRAAHGEAVCSPTMTAALLRRINILANGSSHGRRSAALTARELEIAELIERGLSNKEIGARLRIELPTVKNHVHRILGKLGVDGRAEAAAWVRSGRY